MYTPYISRTEINPGRVKSQSQDHVNRRKCKAYTQNPKDVRKLWEWGAWKTLGFIKSETLGNDVQVKRLFLHNHGAKILIS